MPLYKHVNNEPRWSPLFTLRFTVHTPPIDRIAAKMRFSSRSRSSCRLCFAAPVPSTPNLILAASADPVIRLGTERGWKLHYRPWLLRHLFLASPGFTRKNSFDILSEVVFKILSTSLFQPLKFCLSCFFHWEVFGSWLPDITFLRGCFFIGI